MGSYSHKFRTRSLGVFIGIALAAPLAAQVPAPPPPVPTVWDKLGITQGLDCLRSKTINPHGNHPDCEKKPLLKTIADPANLDPKMPKAVQAAAAIKQQEDLAPQKIKAIKYLATMGCGCYQKTVDVRGALLEALDDCTEEVRYEAAKALGQVAGSPCARCNGTCCDALMMNKLQEHATGKDEKGCFKESSERVRNAAQSALAACQRKVPPGAPETPVLAPRPDEMPTPIRVPSGERPTGVREGPTPIPTAPEPPVPGSQPIPPPPSDLKKPADIPADPLKSSFMQPVGNPLLQPVAIPVDPLKTSFMRPNDSSMHQPVEVSFVPLETSASFVQPTVKVIQKPVEFRVVPPTTSYVQPSANPAPMPSGAIVSIRPVVFEQKKPAPAVATANGVNEIDFSKSTVSIRFVESSNK